ncbi:ABC transporter permease [Chitinophaga ginsengisoli]|uniref:ABC-type antimicrobial peptide transport system permease subunit n=1 Tax=Chitinophaga ginsengisoli TaxID=363837 RepID=A0A2P8FMS9_9BACT|nr:ABC transporter permease [Chitinophaga ginsengisoli]PSL23027.1 ABC-type antimicrobial peptide transport system permease subunit [Chitinophaga ginsengisoli]
MFKNYLKVAFRYLRKNKAHSFINITGLSVGMAVAMLIGLWIWSELSFDKYHDNYDRIAQVMQQETLDGTIRTERTIPLPLEAAMRESYGSEFKHIVMSSWTENHTLSVGDKNVSYAGAFMGAASPDMLTLHMLKGTRQGLTGPNGILLSQSLASALFGENDPMDQLVKLDQKAVFKVTGVYDDLPQQSSFHNLAFMAPWDFYVHAKDWIQRDPANWTDNSLFMYVQANDHADMARLSEKIKHIKRDRVGAAANTSQPALFLQPMRKWHLYATFKNGVNTGGAILYVWLFGIIGIFVLLLACINFMNLSTARSEKRAREVGIRKAVGSLRRQLIGQFYAESVLIALLAFMLSLAWVLLALPFFNEVANKKMFILWASPVFWLACLGFTLFAGFIAGSYPALYLSSFKPVKALKGTFKAGRLATVPRSVLVVLQFTVAVVLITGTLIVFRQIQFARDRPVGYSRDGLIYIETSSTALRDHFEAIQEDLLKSGTIMGIAASSSPATGVNNSRGDLDWSGKDPAMTAEFGNIGVTTTYGKTVGWQFTAGRDFSSQFLTDSSGLILNETAVKYMGLKNPIGKIVQVGTKQLHVIGVIKDMVMGSPYEPVKPTIFRMGKAGFFDYMNIRINPQASAHDAIDKITAVCRAYAPAEPFSYKFVSEEYAKKFSDEERIGKLAGCFAGLAIFISCLGLFGMAAFMAEQRFKEIGVRKVLGASVLNIWGLLTKDFVLLVLFACLIATPVAYYFLQSWLLKYDYHTEITWWIFAAAGVGALVIALLTVSFQSISAALMNPVKSLRLE